ncbi:MAG: hypothetical protein HQL06_13245 [Nitrospirae bacterium]|nr:hypothetical protein [Nitrospirota bacterium]
MIWFEKRFYDGVKDGRITLTFRFWDTLRVLRGKIYRSHNLGLLRIIDVDFRRVQSITLDEVRRCGYESMDEFKEDIVKYAEGEVDFEKDRVVKIEFEYIGEDIENYKKSMGNVKDSEIFNIKEQLLILEQKNDTPWIKRTLQLLKEQGYLLSKDIEPVVDMPSDRIKVFMRKLKALHLISSNTRKGYSITPLGSKLLRHLSSKDEEML